MLSQPQETLELQHKQGKPIAVTCLAFPHGDVNNFIVGSEEGSVYTGETVAPPHRTASRSELNALAPINLYLYIAAEILM